MPTTMPAPYARKQALILSKKLFYFCGLAAGAVGGVLGLGIDLSL